MADAPLPYGQVNAHKLLTHVHERLLMLVSSHPVPSH